MDLVGKVKTADVGVDGREVEERLISADGWRRRVISRPMLFELPDKAK